MDGDEAGWVGDVVLTRRPGSARLRPVGDGRTLVASYAARGADARSSGGANLELLMRHLFVVRRLSLGALLVLALPSLTPSPSFSAAAWELLSGPVDAPAAQWGVCAIHDPLGHRMLLIDPESAGDLWSLSLRAGIQPQWQRSFIAGGLPEHRNGVSLVYDSARHRVLLFGGGTYVDERTTRMHADVWALSLRRGGGWTQLDPAPGPAPAARAGHLAVYDAHRDRMVVFSGITADSNLTDTWALELGGTPTWRRLEPAGSAPRPRYESAAVYDPWGRRMLIHAGYRYTEGQLDDTWALALGDAPRWDSLAVEGAPRRSALVAVVDSVRREMVVSSGYDTAWALSLDGPPVGRRLPMPGPGTWGRVKAGVYSPERWSLITYGSRWVPGDNACSELDLTTGLWRTLRPPAPPAFPLRQADAGLVVDSRTGAILQFGGPGLAYPDSSGGLVPVPGPFSFPAPAAEGWEALETRGERPTGTWKDWALAIDSRRNRWIMLGGGTQPLRGHRIDEVWELPVDEPRTWTRLPVTGALPQGRREFRVIYDPVRDRVLLFGGAEDEFGGSDRPRDIDDVWTLSLGTLTWSRVAVQGAPGGRRWPTVLYDARRDRMLVIAGYTSGFRQRIPRYDSWFLPLSSDEPTWQPLGSDAPSTVPPVLDSARDRLVLWSGDVAAWDLPLAAPGLWRPLEAAVMPPARRMLPATTYDPVQDRLGGFGGALTYAQGAWPSSAVTADLHAFRFSDEVAVDVRPGSADDVVPIRAHGMLEAAILASVSFSPDSVIVSSVTLAGAHACDSERGRGHLERRDVDHDGRADLVLRFPIDSLRLAQGDTVAMLWGETPNFEIHGRARVRVVPGEGRTMAGIERHAELGDLAFGPREFLLAPICPAVSGLRIRYALPAAGAAWMEVFDLAGRRVLARELDASAAGPQELVIERGALRPGVFLLRLTQGSRVLTARAVVLR